MYHLMKPSGICISHIRPMPLRSVSKLDIIKHTSLQTRYVERSSVAYMPRFPVLANLLTSVTFSMIFSAGRKSSHRALPCTAVKPNFFLKLSMGEPFQVTKLLFQVCFQSHLTLVFETNSCYILGFLDWPCYKLVHRVFVVLFIQSMSK